MYLGALKCAPNRIVCLLSHTFSSRLPQGRGGVQWGGVWGVGCGVWGVGRMYTGRGKYCPADFSIFLDLDVCFYSTNTLDGRLQIHLGMPRREKNIIRNRKYSVSLVPGGL